MHTLIVMYTLILNKFVIQYDKAVHARRVAEEEDPDNEYVGHLKSDTHRIDRVASERYSRCIFKKFKLQIITVRTGPRAMMRPAHGIGSVMWRSIRRNGRWLIT